jgi:beta-lactamase superfamily II metal-dependent hydrolase
MAAPSPDANTLQVHLLDVGSKQYADAVLCQFGKTSVLIDGAHPGNDKPDGRHPSIPDQIATLLAQTELPYHVDLLIVSHAHDDHIGCLPKLVKSGTLTATWALVVDPDLGWGRSEEGDSRDTALPAVQKVVAGLREERLSDAPPAEIDALLADAATLETRYREMLELLEANGTKVVRHITDDHSELEQAFSGIGLKILGPSEEQVLRCAEEIARLTGDLVEDLEASAQSDAGFDPIEAYREFFLGGADDLEADASRPGHAINLQSLVTRFKYAGKKILFAGDMQFAAPGTRDEDIQREVTELRRRIEADGPFEFAKISHHGSDNAFDEELYEEWGSSPFLGICAGENSTRHPRKEVLDILKRNRDATEWARTDRNGQSSIEIDSSGGSGFEVTKGRVNDARPNSRDAIALPLLVERQPQPEVAAPVARRIVGRGDERVEIRAYVPHTATRVRLTIEVEPAGADEALPQGAGAGIRRADRKLAPAARVGRPRNGVRVPPNLLFVTSRAILAEKIGRSETEQVLRGIENSGSEVLDLGGRAEPADPAGAVRSRLSKGEGTPMGVVILGGFDVVPSYRVDCLTPALRRRLAGVRDPDQFYVWSDDLYGDQDGDSVMEIPVSRIPDGRSPKLVARALGAGGRRPAGRPAGGIRNIERPFADDVFASVPGAAQLYRSEPTRWDQPKPVVLDGDIVYLMLHGHYRQPDTFWGEPSDCEAFSISSIPEGFDGVVLSGCCWGALTVRDLASQPRAPRPLTPDQSISLSYLLQGARAFVGCTGVHYSPLDAPYGHYGGPMHRLFLQGLLGGAGPAKALSDAKLQYAAEIPHLGNPGGVHEAVERKIWRQFACLGLGW